MAIAYPCPRANYGYVLDSGFSSYRRRRKHPKCQSLCAAAHAGDVVDVVSFIDRGDDVNGLDGYGDKPIHKACESRSELQHRVVEYLLKHGADPYARTVSGQTVLHLLAVSKSRNKILSMRLLIDFGVPVDFPDAIGRSPLFYVLATSEQVSDSVIRFFIVNGAHFHPASIESMRFCSLDRIESSIIYSYLSQDPHVRGSHPTSFLRSLAPFFESWADQMETFQNDFITPSFTLFDFLRSDEKMMSQFAHDAHLSLLPLIQLKLKQSSRPLLGIALRVRLKELMRDQFDLFSYHFVKIHLTRLTCCGVTLPYDCVLSIASYLEYWMIS